MKLKVEEGTPQLSELYFASSNKHKYQEAKSILKSFGIPLHFFKIELEEIQSNSLSEIALKKSTQAFQKLKKPVIVEDDGLFINSLEGFPGPYLSYVFKANESYKLSLSGIAGTSQGLPVSMILNAATTGKPTGRWVYSLCLP